MSDPVCARCSAGRGLCLDCREAKSYEKARKVPAAEWSGPVFQASTNGDRMFSTLDEAVEWYEEELSYRKSQGEAITIPTFVWGSSKLRFRVDAEDVIDRLLESLDGEDVPDLAEGAEEELQALLDTWCEKHRIDWYELDYGVAVLLPPLDLDLEA